MAEFDNIAFNIAAFISGLFVLEFGADKFIDNTATVAARLDVSPTLIALLTSGAEWEEVCENIQNSIRKLTKVAHRGCGRHLAASTFTRNW